MPYSYHDTGTIDGYGCLNGTSPAAPTVTGTVAQMIQATRKAFSGKTPSPNAVKAMRDVRPGHLRSRCRGTMST